MKHTLVALLRDRPGVLNRAVSLLRRRGFNIESLTVAPSETAGVSRMTMVIDVDDIARVIQQFGRLIEVLDVSDAHEVAAVEREAVLVRIDATRDRLAELVSLITRAGARVVDTGPTATIIELCDTPSQVAAFVGELATFGVREVMRSGRLAMARAGDATRAAHYTCQADGGTDDAAA